MSRRLLVPAAMLGAIGVGSLILQRWVAETMTAALILSVIWAGIVALGFLAYARHRRELLAPIAGALVLGAAIGGFSYWYFSVRDTEVDETVAVAQSRAAGAQARLGLSGGSDSPDPGGQRSQAGRRGPVELARGSFTGVDGHDGGGTATVVQLPGGGRMLTFTRFDVDPGADVDVYLVPGDGSEVGDRIELGGLKGNVGDQQYEIPSDADLNRYRTVVLYCIPFTVRIAVAPLS